jgi:hypothetical protein
MSKILTPRQFFETPQKSAAGGRVFKISLNGVPPVTSKMWAQMKVTARMRSKDRRYPEIAEVADASI